jgi:hypothetical protein
MPHNCSSALLCTLLLTYKSIFTLPLHSSVVLLLPIMPQRLPPHSLDVDLTLLLCSQRSFLCTSQYTLPFFHVHIDFLQTPRTTLFLLPCSHTLLLLHFLHLFHPAMLIHIYRCLHTLALLYPCSHIPRCLHTPYITLSAYHAHIYCSLRTPCTCLLLHAHISGYGAALPLQFLASSALCSFPAGSCSPTCGFYLTSYHLSCTCSCASHSSGS